MRRSVLFRLLLATALGLGPVVAACSGGGSAAPPVAQGPTQVAACLTFVLEDAPPPSLNPYDLQTVVSVRKAVVAELVAAGFAIVDSRDRPHDVILKLTATPGSRIESNAELRGKFQIEGAKGPIDEVEAGTPSDAPGAVEAVAAALVDELFRSGNLGGYIKQLRRPGSAGLARTSLRDAAPACAGFVVAASASAPAASAPVVSASVAAPEPAAPPPASPLAGAAQPDAFAIIFGVEQYKSAPAAPGARSDAERMAQVATRTLGVPEAHVKTAFDQKADRLAIDLNIEWLKLNVPKGGRIYFYFAGNGTGGKAPGTPALMPYDGDAKTGAKTITVTALLQALSETKAADTILLVDAAFGGAGGRSAPAGEGGLFSVRGASSVVRTAMLAGVTSAEGARATAAGGVFTQYLIEGLGFGHADVNADGRVTLQELSSWVGPRVSRAAKRDGRSQTPTLLVGPAVLPIDKLALAKDLETP